MIKFLVTPTYPKVVLTSLAFVKMVSSLKVKQVEDLEYMFLGEVEKIDNTKFVIQDIVFTPQLVTGATVETDDEKYVDWLTQNYPHPKSRKKIRLHGHSHVNMGVTPSGEDNKQLSRFIDQISDFFIQLIINKKGDYTLNLFNKETNLIYEKLDLYLEMNGILIKCENFLNNLKFDMKPINLNDYEITYSAHKLHIGNDLEFDFRTLSYSIKDVNMEVSEGKPIIYEEDLLIEILAEEFKEKVKRKYETTITSDSTNSPYNNLFDDYDFLDYYRYTPTKPFSREPIKGKNINKKGKKS